MRTSSLAKLLESHAKSFTEKEKEKFEGLKKQSQSKLEIAKKLQTPQLQTRALDNFDVLTKEKKQELIERYQALRDEIAPLVAYDIETHAEKYKESPVFHLTDEILQSRLICLDRKANPSIQQKLTCMLDEITSMACAGVLDGHGRIRWDIVNHFAWNAFKDELNSEMIVESYVHAVIALLLAQSCDPDSNENVQKACHAINFWFNDHYSAFADKAVKETQKNDFYNQFVSNIIEYLSHYDSRELSHYRTVLDEIITQDFHHAKQHAQLHLQRAKFWIDTLHQLLLVYDRQDLFIVLWPLVEKQIYACYENADVENSFAVEDEDAILSHQEYVDKLYLCSLHVSPAKKVESHQTMKMEKKEELQHTIRTICYKRDKSVVVDEIMKEYLSKSFKLQTDDERQREEKIEAEERVVLRNLISSCEDKKSDTTIKEMLDNSFQKQDTSLLKEGRLLNILNNYSTLFDTKEDSVKQKNCSTDLLDHVGITVRLQ